MSPKVWIFCGAVLGAVGVGLGAYHAHGLEKALTARALAPDEVLRDMQNFDVGVRYEMYHALALVLVGLLMWRAPATCLHVAGILFLVGTILFCGGLFFPVLSGTKLPWYIVPSGGTMLIVAWAVLAIGTVTCRAIDRCEVAQPAR
jgi:uncharacterized membrane protein YgdD (TMEM256/DUF423 family)